MVDECKVVNVTQDIELSTLIFRNKRAFIVVLTFDGVQRNVSPNETFAYDVPVGTLHTWSAKTFTGGYNAPSGVICSPDGAGTATTISIPIVGVDEVLVCGDIDGDGIVTTQGAGIDDLVLLILYNDSDGKGTSLSGLTANQMWAMDINGDGVVDGADAQQMLLCYIGGGDSCNFACPVEDRVSPCSGIGDPDMDGYVTSADVDVIGSMIGETWDTTSNLEQFRRADTDGTGKITMSDLAQVGNYISGGIDTFPACSLAPMLVTEFTVACPASGDCTDCKAPCDVNVHIVWMNMGGMTATLTPGYTVDGIPKTFAPVVLEPGQTAALDTVEDDLPFKDGMYTICAIPYAVASSV